MTKTKKISLKSLNLKSGAHKTPEDGMCVMEAVSYFAGEPHSDKPVCACPVLTSFMITLNDKMSDSERVILKPYIKKLIGTRDGNSQKRLNLLVRASAAVFAADALRLTNIPELVKHADILGKFKDFGLKLGPSILKKPGSQLNTQRIK